MSAEHDDPTPTAPLVCVECGREQRDGERCWRSLQTTDRDEPSYERQRRQSCSCPECALG
jgi:hypothetical protein